MSENTSWNSIRSDLNHFLEHNDEARSYFICNAQAAFPKEKHNIGRCQIYKEDTLNWVFHHPTCIPILENCLVKYNQKELLESIKDQVWECAQNTSKINKKEKTFLEHWLRKYIRHDQKCIQNELAALESRFKEKIDQQAADILEHKRQLDTQHNTILEESKLRSDQGAMISEQGTKISNQEKELSEHKHKIDQQQKTISGLDSEVNRQAAKILEQDDKISKLTSQIKALEDEIRKKDTLIKEIQARCDTLAQCNEDTESTNEELKKEIEQLKKDKASLLLTVARKKEKIKQLKYVISKKNDDGTRHNGVSNQSVNEASDDAGSDTHSCTVL